MRTAYAPAVGTLSPAVIARVAATGLATSKLRASPTNGQFVRWLAVIAAATALAAPALASPPAAWQQLQQQAQRSCIAASNFRQPRASDMIIFDDVTGVVALLVSGTFRQRRMRGASGTNLCLYNRKTGTVAVEEAAGWGVKR